jgi:hypothetical protein
MEKLSLADTAYSISNVWRFERNYGYVWIFYRKLHGWCYCIVFDDKSAMPLTDHDFDTPDNALQYVMEWEERVRG